MRRSPSGERFLLVLMILKSTDGCHRECEAGNLLVNRLGIRNTAEMDRKEAIDALASELAKKWESAQKAYERSKAGATSGESKQESKYDTRGLEEAYLAHGLSQAVMEAEKAVNDLEVLREVESGEVIKKGSLLRVRRDGEQCYFFLSHSGGGVEAVINGIEVTIITPESPVAKKLIGKGVGARYQLLVVEEIL